LLSIAGNVGNTIVETAITNWIKPYVDPLVISLTDQTLAVTGNTAAVAALTSAITTGATGSAPNGGVVTPAGKDGKTNNPKPVKPGLSDIGLGLAAYGVFQNGQQSGNWLTGGLGGVMAATSLGLGPVGMAVGGVIGLIGGLFGGKKKDPLETSKATNPSLYNAPEDFLYNAYRYRATGQLPNTMNGMIDWRTNAPIVNVYVDGVKTAVKTELTSATSLGRAAQANTYIDYHGPN
jgi:hypothetical protein